MDIRLKKAAIEFMRVRNWDTFMGLVDSGLTRGDIDTLGLMGYINKPSDFKWLQLDEVNCILNDNYFLRTLFDPIKLFQGYWYHNLMENVPTYRDFEREVKGNLIEFIYNITYYRHSLQINLGDESHIEALSIWVKLLPVNYDEDDSLKQSQYQVLTEVFNSLEYTYTVDEFDIIEFKSLYKDSMKLFKVMYPDGTILNKQKQYLNNVLKDNANFITTVDEVVNLIITRFEELGLGEAKDIGALRVNKLLYYCLRRAGFFLTVEGYGISEFTFTDLLFNSDADFINTGVVVPGYNNSMYDEWIESYNRDKTTPLLDRHLELKSYISHCIDELIPHSQFTISQLSNDDIRNNVGGNLVSEVDGKRYVYLSDMICYN